MLQKLSTWAVLAAAQFGAFTSAQDTTAIPDECISSREPFASDVVGERAFDQTMSIANLLPIGFTPFEFALCLDDLDRLVSVTFTYANESGTQRRTLPRVGASGGECEQVSMDDRSHMDQALIYVDDAGVAGMHFFSNAGTRYELGDIPTDAPIEQLQVF